MFRLLKIIKNYREEISYIEIKQLITDKMPIKVALLLDILIYTFSLNYHRKTRLYKGLPYSLFQKREA